MTRGWTAEPIAERARRVAEGARRRAADLDRDGASLKEDVAALAEDGLLLASFPPEMGGEGLGLGADPLHDALVAMGRGSLALGRLFEGHCNAVVLVRRYGTPANLRLLLAEAREGRPSGVWMAGLPLRLEHGRISGRKILASGCGLVCRPLVAADLGADGAGGSQMLIPLIDAARADASGWTAQGMRATATGTVDFSGLAVADDELIGHPDDYLRPPYFRGGAWRVIAVQFGGLLGLMDSYREQLLASPHREHPLQLARYGEALIAAETARMWVREAATQAEGGGDPATIDAYVDLARNGFERAALQAVALAQKAIGLNAFLRPNPLERIGRDLATYLRQPALDASLMAAAAFHLRDAPAGGPA